MSRKTDISYIIIQFKHYIYKMKNNLPIYNIELGTSTGVLKMSLVDSPAVMTDFIAFSEEKQLNFSVDEEQHIVFGCALRADFPIYRFNKEMGEYYVVFTKETIKQLYEKFMIEGRIYDVNTQHSTDVEGVSLIQSFIKDKEKGINPVGFEDVEDGSWFCAYKIQNEEVWEDVKSGKFKGFSVEGFFTLNEAKFDSQEPEEVDELEQYIDEILK